MATNREVFDSIAASWYGFRHWPLLGDELRDLAARWRTGRLVDLGCAHGADLLPFRSSFDLVGLDFSHEMLVNGIRFMDKHGLRGSLVQGDIVSLPLASSSFQFAVAVATYHHVEGGQRRLDSFIELRRVLRPGGEAFVTVWNHGQPRFEDGPRDVAIPWRSGDHVLQRYYHLFDYRELRAILTDAGFEILALGPEKRHRGIDPEQSQNICALVRR